MDSTQEADMGTVIPRSPIEKQKSSAQSLIGYPQHVHGSYARRSKITNRSTFHVITSTTASSGQYASELQEHIISNKGNVGDATLPKIIWQKPGIWFEYFRAESTNFYLQFELSTPKDLKCHCFVCSFSTLSCEIFQGHFYTVCIPVSCVLFNYGAQ